MLYSTMNELMYGIWYVIRTGRGLPAFARRGKNHHVNQWSALYAKLVISIDTAFSYCGILLNKYKINISYYPKKSQVLSHWVLDFLLTMLI